MQPTTAREMSDAEPLPKSENNQEQVMAALHARFDGAQMQDVAMALEMAQGHAGKAARYLRARFPVVRGEATTIAGGAGVPSSPHRVPPRAVDSNTLLVDALHARFVGCTRDAVTAAVLQTSVHAGKAARILRRGYRELRPEEMADRTRSPPRSLTPPRTVKVVPRPLSPTLPRKRMGTPPTCTSERSGPYTPRGEPPGRMPAHVHLSTSVYAHPEPQLAIVPSDAAPSIVSEPEPEPEIGAPAWSIEPEPEVVHVGVLRGLRELLSASPLELSRVSLAKWSEIGAELTLAGAHGSWNCLGPRLLETLATGLKSAEQFAAAVIVYTAIIDPACSGHESQLLIGNMSDSVLWNARGVCYAKLGRAELSAADIDRAATNLLRCANRPWIEPRIEPSQIPRNIDTASS